MERAGRHSGVQDCFRRKPKVCVTVIMLGIGIGTVLVAYAAFAGVAAGSGLRQVIFLFRHGDRTPTETYAEDPYLDYNWPGGWGALTKKGMLQMYTVGKWIRKEYGSVLKQTYDSESVYVDSSYADRCIMSAGALMAGVYPPGPEDLFTPGLPWRPVPIHSTPRNLDKIITVKAPCPRLDKALQEAYANDSRTADPKMRLYYKKLSEYTGQTVATITDVEFLYNTLEIEEQNGLELPEWTSEFYNMEMRTIAARSLAIFTSNTEQKRLRGGPLLKRILEHVGSFRTGTDKRTAYFYSAHDITLVNVLRTMGFTRELFKPDYAATLILEVHSGSDAEDFEIQLAYLNNTEATVAHRMEIPGCGKPCTFGRLVDTWRDVIPDNWEEECSA